MAALFPRNFYNADTSFTPLFRLLDDFDNYSRHGAAGSRSGSGITHFQPKFDVREVADYYELHGELPGLSKDNIHIEFTEPQTMVVRGRVERTYTEGNAPAGQIQDAANAGAITEGEDPKNTHQATVEDEVDGDTPQSEKADQVENAETAPQKPKDYSKYWLTERSVGEFSRSFNFPSRVDQDAVSASMKDGILSIQVPKAKKHESRRIAVN